MQVISESITSIVTAAAVFGVVSVICGTFLIYTNKTTLAEIKDLLKKKDIWGH